MGNYRWLVSSVCQVASHLDGIGGGAMAIQKKEVMRHSLLLTIPEAALSLRLSRAKVYELISFEDLPVVRFGRAVRVSVKALEQWVERREQGA